MPNTSNALGYNWIADITHVKPVQPLRVTSSLGAVKSTTTLRNGFVHNTYTKQYAPGETLADHFTFALKYEGVDLDFMARVFKQVGPGFIQSWLAKEPTSAYARRIGFFYEWLTGTAIEGVGDANGNYVDAIDPAQYLVATTGNKIRRWRVKDNLPGTPAFCPMITLDGGVADPKVLTTEIEHLLKRFGPETMERAVRWLTIKESRASFVIESEGTEEGRIQRFARAMSTYCGKLDDPLSEEGIQTIQREIMGEVTTGFNLGQRKSPVFVGHTSSTYKPVIDYLAPHMDELTGMMNGLRALAERTRGQNSLLRAGAISFGMVYIHPLADGNGRISRFLINDTLRRDEVIPAPLILPVSAVISENASRRHEYDHALEHFSLPLMAEVAPECSFGETITYPDGVRSNLVFTQWASSLPSWRYPDLTFQTQYLSTVIMQSITEGLRDEALYLQRYDLAETGLKEIIEGTAEDYAAIVRSVTHNAGISNKLRKAYPLVFDNDARAQRIAQIVLESFDMVDAGDEPQ